jgi:hypothetical protein
MSKGSAFANLKVNPDPVKVATEGALGRASNPVPGELGTRKPISIDRLTNVR